MLYRGRSIAHVLPLGLFVIVFTILATLAGEVCFHIYKSYIESGTVIFSYLFSDMWYVLKNSDPTYLAMKVIFALGLALGAWIGGDWWKSNECD